MKNAPNVATVTLLNNAPGADSRYVEVRGFSAHLIDGGVLSFELHDGTVIAYGSGHWVSVEVTFDEDAT